MGRGVGLAEMSEALRGAVIGMRQCLAQRERVRRHLGAAGGAGRRAGAHERPDAERRAAAIIRTSKTGQDNVGEAFRDNLDPTNAGTRATRLSAAQREQLLGGVAEMSRLGDAREARMTSPGQRMAGASRFTR